MHHCYYTQCQIVKSVFNTMQSPINLCTVTQLIVIILFGKYFTEVLICIDHLYEEASEEPCPVYEEILSVDSERCPNNNYKVL